MVFNVLFFKVDYVLYGEKNIFKNINNEFIFVSLQKEFEECFINCLQDKPIYYIFDEEGKVRPVIQSPKKFEQIYSTRWCV